MAVNESVSIEVHGHEELIIEKVGPNRVSVAHYYVQRGDLMSDPEIVFRIDNGIWLPIRYTQHPDVHQYVPNGLTLTEFVNRWSRNLQRQGFVEAAADVNDG